MAILVTGGAGYIGSHMVIRLLENNEEVIVLDSLEKGHKDAVKADTLYVGDIRDKDLLGKIFQENEIEAVIHFAAYSLVGESTTNPIKYYENNVYGTSVLLNKMVEADVKKIVFSSTAAVYGEPECLPITEDAVLNPTNPYGESKLAVEKLLKWSDVAYNLRYVSLRYFNASGAHVSGEIGEDHSPETHLIPLVLEAALGKREYISIFGDDYQTKDGTCIRDYIHVTDLVDAHVLALNELRNKNKSNIYNLGNGKGFSVKEVINVAREVTGLNIKSKIASRREGDPAILIASSEKIKNSLGWDPKLFDLTKIIETAWNWHKNNPQGFCS